MKRAITALSVLCGGILFMSPINNIIFAQNNNNKPSTEVVENINKDIKPVVTNKENKEEVHKEVANIEKQEVTVNKDQNIKNESNSNQDAVEVKENTVSKDEAITNDVAKDNKVEENKNVVENNEAKEEVATNDKVEQDKQEGNKVEVVNVLNQEQAKELLQMRNPSANYTYQGDENTFSTLKEKGLSGFVFLPDYDTDLGFFVEKNTSEIYYFHPSGYLELAI